MEREFMFQEQPTRPESTPSQFHMAANPNANKTGRQSNLPVSKYPTKVWALERIKSITFTASPTALPSIRRTLLLWLVSWEVSALHKVCPETYFLMS